MWWVYIQDLVTAFIQSIPIVIMPAQFTHRQFVMLQSMLIH